MTNFIGFKCDEDFHKAIKSKADLENITVTDLLRRAVTEYMYKDINIQNELLGTLEQVNKNVKKCSDEYTLFHSFFLHYLKYFFAVNISEMDKWKSPDGNKEATFALQANIINKGADYRDKFVANFSKENKHLKKIIEILMADYMTEEAEE